MGQRVLPPLPVGCLQTGAERKKCYFIDIFVSKPFSERCVLGPETLTHILMGRVGIWVPPKWVDGLGQSGLAPPLLVCPALQFPFLTSTFMYVCILFPFLESREIFLRLCGNAINCKGLFEPLLRFDVSLCLARWRFVARVWLQPAFLYYTIKLFLVKLLVTFSL